MFVLLSFFTIFLLSFFITLINLSIQIQNIQTWYTIVNFGLNHPLRCNKILNDFFDKSLWISSFVVCALIALISMSKFDAIFLDLCKSPEMVFCLYLSGILET